MHHLEVRLPYLFTYLHTYLHELMHHLEVRLPRFVGSITNNFVYYTYSRTQLYFTY